MMRASFDYDWRINEPKIHGGRGVGGHSLDEPGDSRRRRNRDVRDLRAGDVVSIRSGVLEIREKVIRFFHERAGSDPLET